MNNQRPDFEKFYSVLKPALLSKVEEFQLLGYGVITMQELWKYLTKKKWKKVKEEPLMYRMIADILSTKPGDYMNFITVEAYRAPSMLTSIDEDELQALLHPNKN
jgi:hypothetical protein